MDKYLRPLYCFNAAPPWGDDGLEQDFESFSSFDVDLEAYKSGLEIDASIKELQKEHIPNLHPLGEHFFVPLDWDNFDRENERSGSKNNDAKPLLSSSHHLFNLQTTPLQWAPHRLQQLHSYN